MHAVYTYMAGARPLQQTRALLRHLMELLPGETLRLTLTLLLTPYPNPTPNRYS